MVRNRADTMAAGSGFLPWRAQLLLNGLVHRVIGLLTARVRFCAHSKLYKRKPLRSSLTGGAVQPQLRQTIADGSVILCDHPPATWRQTDPGLLGQALLGKLGKSHRRTWTCATTHDMFWVGEKRNQ